MGKCILCVHSIVYLLGIITNLAAIALIIASLVTERWLIGEHSISRVRTEIHNHGLWKDCVDFYNTRTFDNRLLWESQTCTLKQYRPDDDPFHQHFGNDAGHSHQGEHNTAHIMRRWNVVVIALLAAAGVCGLIGFLGGLGASVSFCSPKGCCGKCSSVFWFFFLLLGAGFSISAVLYFVYKAYDPEVRSERLTSVNARVEQVKGSSYYQALAAAILFIVAFIFAIVTLTLSCVLGQKRHTATSKVTMMPYTISNTRV